jgi:hypothetical protein
VADSQARAAVQEAFRTPLAVCPWPARPSC